MTDKENKIKERLDWKTWVFIIILTICIYFLASQAISCLPFSPWVQAYGGRLPICAIQ